MQPRFLLAKLYLIKVLLRVAVVATHGSRSVVKHVEAGEHGFVVGDALGVVALDDAHQVVSQFHRLLLYHLIVADDAERNVGGNDGQLVEFLVGEELVSNLNDALVPHLLALEVIAHGDGGLYVLKV